MWKSVFWVVLLSLMNMATLSAQPSGTTNLTFLDGHPDLQSRLLQWETEAPDEVKVQISELRDPSRPPDRHLAAETLGTMGPQAKGAIVALMETWTERPSRFDQHHEKSEWLSAKAERTLAGIGEPAVESLIAALDDHHASVRTHAAGALGRIGDPRNIEPLLAALEDENGFVRLQSARAWREITDRHTLRTVIIALGDKEWPVRSAAAKMLGEIGDPRAVDPLLAALQDPRVQGEAALALGRIGDRRAVEVLVPLLWENPRSDLGWNVLRALRVLDPNWRDTDAAAQLVPDALASLQDENEFVRGDAAWFLGYAADARAIEPLMVALRTDDQSDVRREAAGALGQIGDPRAVEPLLVALSGDTQSDVREEAARALGQIGDPRAIATLIAELRDAHVPVRTAAARALKDITGQHFEDAGLWERWWQDKQG